MVFICIVSLIQNKNALPQMFVLWRPRVICQSNCLRTVEICRIIDKVYWVHSCVSPTTHHTVCHYLSVSITPFVSLPVCTHVTHHYLMCTHAFEMINKKNPNLYVRA